MHIYEHNTRTQYWVYVIDSIERFEQPEKNHS